jgi:hypothetical protein
LLLRAPRSACPDHLVDRVHFSKIAPNNTQLDAFCKLTDVCVLLRRPLVYLHRLDPRVVFCGKGVENEVAVLLDTDKVSRLQFGGVYQTDEGKEDGLARRGFYHGAFPDPSSVEVDVGAFSRFVAGGNVEDLPKKRNDEDTERRILGTVKIYLDDVGDKIRQLLVLLDLVRVVLDLLLLLLLLVS